MHEYDVLLFELFAIFVAAKVIGERRAPSVAVVSTNQIERPRKGHSASVHRDFGKEYPLQATNSDHPLQV
jgi:hypothetical protein